jgi:hypothetical protein
MRKFFLFLLAFGISLIVFGQSGTKTVELSAGALFPIKDLGSTNLADSSSGAAATGYHLQLSYNTLLSDNFGVGIDIDYNAAAFSTRKVLKYYQPILDDTKKEVSHSKGWTMSGLYLRYYLHLSIGQVVSWEASPLLGGIIVYAPAFQIKSTSIIPPGPNATFTYSRNRSSTFSFAYGIETKFNFKFKKSGIFLEGRALRSRARFKHVTGQEYDGTSYDRKITMNLMYFNLSVGYSHYF